MTKKWAPRNILLVNTKKTLENDENFDDFLSNIDEFLQKFDISGSELVGRVKTQQSLQVADFKRVKKKTKGGLF